MHRAGLGDRVERRVDDRVADPPADDVVLAPVDLAPLHAARPQLRVEVAGERVERLVVVVVGVERQVGEVAHDVKATRPVSNDSQPPRRGTTRGPSNTLAGMSEQKYAVISTDCHAGGSMDQYREFLDAKWLEEFDAWRGAYKNPFRDLSGSKRYRNWDSDARLSEMEADGIVAEVAFPNTVPPFFPSASFMARAPRRARTTTAAGPDCKRTTVGSATTSSRPRRNGAAGMAQILLNDIDDAVETGALGGRERSAWWRVCCRGAAGLAPAAAVRERRVRTALGCVRGDRPAGQPPFGSAAPDYGRYPAGGVMWILETGFYAHRAFWALIFGGVFERHPKLKFVLAESGMGWIADEMPRTDYMAKRIFGGKVGELGFTEDQRLPKLPSEYFQQNIWVTASFMAPAECRKRHKIGVDKVMWASDYPHDEGTYPYSEQSLRNTFHDVPENEARMMLSETAAQHLRLRPRCAANRSRTGSGSRPSELATPPDALPTDSESNAFAGR